MKKTILLSMTVAFLLFAHKAIAREAVTYDQAVQLSKSLLEQEFTEQNRKGIRDHSLTLASLLQNFTLNEGEVRASSKVAPPISAITRPGEAPKASLLDLPAGEKVALSKVPDEWFLGMIDQTRIKMRMMIKLQEKQDADMGELKALAVGIHRDLSLVVHPPKQ